MGIPVFPIAQIGSSIAPLTPPVENLNINAAIGGIKAGQALPGIFSSIASGLVSAADTYQKSRANELLAQQAEINLQKAQRGDALEELKAQKIQQELTAGKLELAQAQRLDAAFETLRSGNQELIKETFLNGGFTELFSKSPQTGALVAKTLAPILTDEEKESWLGDPRRSGESTFDTKRKEEAYRIQKNRLDSEAAFARSDEFATVLRNNPMYLKRDADLLDPNKVTVEPAWKYEMAGSDEIKLDKGKPVFSATTIPPATKDWLVVDPRSYKVLGRISEDAYKLRDATIKARAAAEVAGFVTPDDVIRSSRRGAVPESPQKAAPFTTPAISVQAPRQANLDEVFSSGYFNPYSLRSIIPTLSVKKLPGNQLKLAPDETQVPMLTGKGANFSKDFSVKNTGRLRDLINATADTRAEHFNWAWKSEAMMTSDRLSRGLIDDEYNEVKTDAIVNKYRKKIADRRYSISSVLGGVSAALGGKVQSYKDIYDDVTDEDIKESYVADRRADLMASVDNAILGLEEIGIAKAQSKLATKGSVANF